MLLARQNFYSVTCLVRSCSKSRLPLPMSKSRCSAPLLNPGQSLQDQDDYLDEKDYQEYDAPNTSRNDEPLTEEEERKMMERKMKRKLKKDREMERKLKQLPEWLQKSIPVDSLPEAKKVDPQILPQDPTFSSLGIKIPTLEHILREEWKVTKPSRIQALAAPLILEGNHVFAADQTGTGKTFAYLLPILQLLKDQEKVTGYRRRGQHARAIIMVPTRELVEQVTKILTKIISSVPDFKHFNAHGMAGGLSKPKKEFQWLNKGIDILVATAERVSYHLDKKHLELTDTQTIVLDEADTLFGVETYRQQIMHIVYLCRKVSRLYATAGTKARIQYIWVSATVSKEVASYISKEFPDAVQTFSDSLHKSVSGLKQDFLFGSSGKWRERLLFDTLRKYRGKRTMVFCNTIEKAKYVYNMLESAGYKAGLFTSDLNRDKRAKTFDEFDTGAITILVTTDIGSRGLDMKESVEHVILYEFPLNAIDYLHRIGRTARAGKKGLVTSFFGARDQALVEQIRDAYANDVSLTDVKPSLELQKPKRRKRSTEEVDPKYLEGGQRGGEPSSDFEAEWKEIMGKSFSEGLKEAPKKPKSDAFKSGRAKGKTPRKVLAQPKTVRSKAKASSRE